jgi:hypothetical protein
MTLLDAPKYDAPAAKRRVRILIGAVVFLFVLIVAGWFVAGRPLDVPWAWWNDGMARFKVNVFLKAVEEKDMAKAYTCWTADKDWQKHPEQYKNYDFNRFQQDWAPLGQENDYGTIVSHQITIEKQSGNTVILCVYINGRKTPIFLSVDNATRSVGFSPNELYVGP